jgi:hypothetical protein
MATSTVVLALVRAARPQLTSRAGVAAFAVHAVLSAEGWELAAVGDAALGQHTSTAPEASLDGWDTGGDVFAFAYTQGKWRLLVKALATGASLQVDAAVSSTRYERKLAGIFVSVVN